MNEPNIIIIGAEVAGFSIVFCSSKDESIKPFRPHVLPFNRYLRNELAKQ